jgi:hypothetical protein
LDHTRSESAGFRNQNTNGLVIVRMAPIPELARSGGWGPVLVPADPHVFARRLRARRMLTTVAARAETQIAYTVIRAGLDEEATQTQSAEI